MHPLLLSPGVDGDHPRVHDDHHSDDEVVLLQDHVGDEWHQVQGLLLRAAKLRHHHQQVGPCKHGTAKREVGKVQVSATVRYEDQQRHVKCTSAAPYLSAMLRWARDTDVSMSIGW